MVFIVEEAQDLVREIMIRVDSGVMLFAALQILASCTGSEPSQPVGLDGDTCGSADECVEGLLCLLGRCRTPCVDVPDCPTGSLCEDGYCVPGEEPSQCEEDGSSDGSRCNLPGDRRGVCIAARGGCVESECGDDFLDRQWALEECDDGDTIDNGEGECLADCSGIQTCGDGAIEGTEVCDDNDTVSNGEGFCVADCTGIQRCGDGVVTGLEVCDDAGDSLQCDDDCTLPSCGDGQVNTALGESCDDGGIEDDDGCSSLCVVQLGWGCSGEPSVCTFGAMRMIQAAGKAFTMGSPSTEAGHISNETQHVVTFTHDYWIKSIEVTQDEFQDVMGWNPSSELCAECPVENVSWYDSVAYTNELTQRKGGTPCYVLEDVICEDTLAAGSYMNCMNDNQGGIESATVSLNGVSSVYDCTGFRLPTEAEWEYATRAGTQTVTYNGDPDPGLPQCQQPNAVLDPIAWFCGNSGLAGPLASGTRTPNAWGLHDTLGNLLEWCHDWYAPYPGDVTDPEGPPSGPHRVIRGGYWANHAQILRTAFRFAGVFSFEPGARGPLGIRPARSAH